MGIPLEPGQRAGAQHRASPSATAHYVTARLDEGPIIEQEVMRVDHTYGPVALVTAGRDSENLALARAVTWHGQNRILLNNDRTVVFR